jgi:hypothetical protein
MDGEHTDPVDRARALRERALESPTAVDVDEIRSLLADPTMPASVHEDAVTALLDVARSEQSVGGEFAGLVARLLGRPALDADPLLLRCLRALATESPTAVLEHRDAIVDRVTVEDDETTQAATGCCVELVGTDPGAFIDVVPTLSALLDADDPTRTNALYILSQLALGYPEEVRPVVPQLLDGISDRETAYQTNALSALGAIASAYPAAALDAVEELTALAASEQAGVRGNAVGLLADVAQEHPGSMTEAVDVMIERLDDEDEYVRGNAVSAVLHVGLERPDAITEARDGLRERLDDPAPIVRSNACKAVAGLEIDGVRNRLERLEADDPNENVREHARWALTQLE